MLKQLFDFIKPTRHEPVQLFFTMDLDETEHHIVRVYKLVGQEKVLVKDIPKLLVYGYHEDEMTSDALVVRAISPEDRQSLLALNSLNPIAHEDGSLEFDIEPPILGYLRRKPNTEETDQAKQVKVLDQPLQPAAQIDYDPDIGLKVAIGFRIDENQVIPANQTRTSKDGNYIRVGHNFMPTASLDKKARAVLEEPVRVIPPDDIPGFLLGDMVVLKTKFDVQETESAKQVKILDEPLRPAFQVDYQPEKGLRVETGYSLGGGKLTPASQLSKTRDGNYVRLGSTFAALAKVSQQAKAWLETPVRLIPIRNVPEFFLRDLVLVKSEFNAVLTDLAQQIRVFSGPMTPVVRINKDPQGWLDFSMTYESNGYEFSADLLPKKGETGYIQADANTWVAVDPATIREREKQLAELAAIPIEGGYRLPASEFATLEEFIAAIGGRAEVNKAYQEFLSQLSGFQGDEHFRLSEKFENYLGIQQRSLYPYQRAGIHWLSWLQANHLHGVLADDMGLGKTLQSLCAMRLAYEETKSQQHSLIIAPKSVLLAWHREIKHVFPYFRVLIYHGPKRQESVFQSSLPYIIITTYETVGKDIEILSHVPFFYLILDEATRIKNPDARRTQAIKSLNAVHRLAISGTPVENRPLELWSLFDFLMRGHLGKYGTFQSVFENSILSGNQATSEQLGRRIRPFILRRKKEQVAADLPPKVPITEWCELTPEQRSLYGGLQDQFKAIRVALQRGEEVNYATTILPLLTKLKQVCDHPALVTKTTSSLYNRSEKFDWIIDKISEIVELGEQVVVFSHFLGMLGLIEKAIQEKGFRYITIQGSTENRQALIDQFNAGKAQVALLSILAAGHGITMTAANHVIHADRWWNPAVEDQATDRVHRIGQTRTVFIYQILVQGTLEERIDRLLDKKRGIADQIINAATQDSFRWSREELMELLRPLD